MLESSELSPPIAESALKRYTKDWAASISKERWRCTKHDTKTKSFDSSKITIARLVTCLAEGLGSEIVVGEAAFIAPVSLSVF